RERERERDEREGEREAHAHTAKGWEGERGRERERARGGRGGERERERERDSDKRFGEEGDTQTPSHLVASLLIPCCSNGVVVDLLLTLLAAVASGINLKGWNRGGLGLGQDPIHG